MGKIIIKIPNISKMFDRRKVVGADPEKVKLLDMISNNFITEFGKSAIDLFSMPDKEEAIVERLCSRIRSKYQTVDNSILVKSWDVLIEKHRNDPHRSKLQNEKMVKALETHRPHIANIGVEILD